MTKASIKAWHSKDNHSFRILVSWECPDKKLRELGVEMPDEFVDANIMAHTLIRMGEQILTDLKDHPCERC